MLKDFIDARLAQWQKLEGYVSRLSRERLTGLKRDEVREFGKLYRRTATDLAIAHEEVRDSRLVNYLNNLVVRSHGLIYRTEKSGFSSVMDFFRYELPAVFRETFRYTLLAFLIFLAGVLFGAGFTWRDENFADASFLGLREKIANRENWTDRVNENNPANAAGIQTNNIYVSFISFVGGLTAGVLTVFEQFYNGMMVGVLIPLSIKYKFYAILLFMPAHGVLELSAIFISGGAGLLLAEALLMPGELTRRDAFKQNGLKAIKLIFGVVVMLLIAGTIEGFLSPAHISPYYKFAVAIITGILMVLYYMKPDLRKSADGGPIPALAGKPLAATTGAR